MAVDYTVNIGNILTMLSILGGGAMFIGATSKRLESVESELSKMTAAMVELARQDERMKYMERRLQMIEDAA